MSIVVVRIMVSLNIVAVKNNEYGTHDEFGVRMMRMRIMSL